MYDTFFSSLYCNYATNYSAALYDTFFLSLYCNYATKHRLVQTVE